MVAASDPWPDEFRARLRHVRQERGLSFERVVESTKIAKSSLLAIEGGESQNVYLDQVCALSVAYDVPLLDLVQGWKGKRIPSGAVAIDVPALDAHVRASIRRDRGELGTPALAERARMEQSTLVRWESGEYERIDLIRLIRLCDALGASLRSWLTSQ